MATAAILTGGRVGVPAGPTTGQIIFRTVIDRTYKQSGAPVTEGDQLSNTLSASSTIVGQTGTPGDTSSAGLTISTANVLKSVYAVNGVTVSTANPTRDRRRCGHISAHRSIPADELSGPDADRLSAASPVLGLAD